MDHPLDAVATRLFTLAILDGRAGEVLECLFEGGSVTVDRDGQLVLASSDLIEQFGTGD